MLTVNIRKAKDLLEKLIVNKDFTPVFLSGGPGLGKSSIVRQLCEKHALGFRDIRLTLRDPVDLRGLPKIQDGRTVWIAPEELPREGKGILFLDELNAATPSVQVAAYQLVLDRKLGEYQLPSEWFIWAAGNTAETGLVFEMPLPLKNRFLHIHVVPDLDAFKEYAYEAGFDPSIIAYLNWRPDRLYLLPQDPTHWSFPTPRSWEMVNRVLGIDKELVISAIGEATGREFLTFMKLEKTLPNVEAIVKNGKFELLRGLKEDVLWFVLQKIVYIANQTKKKEILENCILVAKHIPAEFTVTYIKDLLKTKARNMLINHPVLIDLCQQYAYEISGTFGDE